MELVFPDYEGSSIVNFSAGLLEHFMAQRPDGSVPYSFESNKIDLSGSEKVVVFVIDALGYFNLLRIMEENSFRLFSREDIRILTSVFPSTTTAALTSIFTANTPSRHGFLGYLLNIPEYGGLVNMIELTPYTQDRDNLYRAANHLRIAERSRCQRLPPHFEELREHRINQNAYPRRDRQGSAWDWRYTRGTEDSSGF
jgi:hypothetical protein